MILDKKPLDVLVSDDMDEISYQLSNSEADQAILFEILREKIYKNKIGSICREIASNSRDAHREVKQNKLTEIEIITRSQSLFHTGSSCIIFRDFGPGLSPWRIKNIYSVYGKSTKRESNDETGGFGLGAKTPMAYTDLFTIRTIVDGKEYLYSSYIDASYKGKIAKMEEKGNKEFEGNMTEIIIPIQDADRETFEFEVRKNTFFWKQRPILKGFNDAYYQPLRYITDSDGKEIHVPGEYTVFYMDQFIESFVNVCIDGIYYPVDTTALGYPSDLNYSKAAIMLYFNNGDIPVSANRETLQYDNYPVELIKTKVNMIIDKFRNEFSDSISNKENLFAACRYHKEMIKSPLYKMIHGHTPFTYPDPVTGSSLKLNADYTFNFEALNFYLVDWDSSASDGRFSKENIEHFNTGTDKHLLDNVYYISKKEWSTKNERLVKAISSTIHSRTGKFLIAVEKYFCINSLNDEALAYNRDVYERCERDSVRLLQAGIKIIGDYYSVEPDKVARVRQKNIIVRDYNYNTETYDFEDGYFYKDGFRVDNFVYIYSEKEMSLDYNTKRVLGEFQELMSKAGDNRKIVICSALKLKYFKNYENIIDVQVLREKMKDYVTANFVYNRIPNYNSHLHLELPEYRDFLKRIDYLRQNKTYDLQAAQAIMGIREVSKEIEEIRETNEKLQKDYPIINSFYIADRLVMRRYIQLEKEFKNSREKVVNLN